MKYFYNFLKLSFTIFFIYFACLLLSRPSRTNVEKKLFYGVNYQRIVLSEPRRLLAHVIEINRFAPGLRVLITPSELNGKLKAQTTSSFLKKYNVNIAINGGYFQPQWADLPFDYYPHEGDEVEASSFATSNGQMYSKYHSGYSALCIFDDMRMEIMNQHCPQGVRNAISGGHYIVKKGEIFERDHEEKHPRSAIGFSSKVDKIWLVVVDGRQPFYSEGLYLDELGEFMIALGAEEALELDGGGSATLVISKTRGVPEVLNSPVQTGIYGKERPVANHLGFYLDSERISE